MKTPTKASDDGEDSDDSERSSSSAKKREHDYEAWFLYSHNVSSEFH